MNYYNEFDTKTAAWLRELISAKLIPAGDVDTRSIVDVSADELRGYTQCHFFAGIGGWSLALQLAGWPADKPVWSLSCPCQPFSTAGKGLGAADERHLWPVAFNLIKECRPPVVFGEQVASSAVVGPSKPTRKMQDLRDKQALLGILQKLEGGIAGNMQGVRQGQGAYSEEVKAGDYQARLQEMEERKPRPCTCECGKEQSQEFQNSIRHFSGEYSEEDRQRLLRSDWNSIRSDYSKGMECSIFGSNHTQSGLYNGEYPSGLICPKCHGELMGATEDSRGIQGDIEVETRSIKQIIGSDWNETSGAPEECWLDGISSDLGEEGYTCGSAVLGAHSVGSPHIRQRLYWVAYSDSGQCQELRPSRDIPSKQPIQPASCGSASDRMADPEGEGRLRNWGIVERGDDEFQWHQERKRQLCESEPQGLCATHWSNCTTIPCRDGKARRIPTESAFFPLAHGISARMVRLRGYGNAIVPQVAAEFIQAFQETQAATA